jgi:hypothetical protein
MESEIQHMHCMQQAENQLMLSEWDLNQLGLESMQLDLSGTQSYTPHQLQQAYQNPQQPLLPQQSLKQPPIKKLKKPMPLPQPTMPELELQQPRQPQHQAELQPPPPVKKARVRKSKHHPENNLATTEMSSSSTAPVKKSRSKPTPTPTASEPHPTMTDQVPPAKATALPPAPNLSIPADKVVLPPQPAATPVPIATAPQTNPYLMEITLTDPVPATNTFPSLPFDETKLLEMVRERVNQVLQKQYPDPDPRAQVPEKPSLPRHLFHNHPQITQHAINTFAVCNIAGTHSCAPNGIVYCVSVTLWRLQNQKPAPYKLKPVKQAEFKTFFECECRKGVGQASGLKKSGKKNDEWCVYFKCGCPNVMYRYLAVLIETLFTFGDDCSLDINFMPYSTRVDKVAKN